MDRLLIIVKKENGPRASSSPALGLNTIIFKYVYWYMKQISGECLQDHWSSGLGLVGKGKTLKILILASVIIYNMFVSIGQQTITF